MDTPQTEKPAERRFGWLHVFGFVSLAVVLTVLATAWILRTYVFPREFRPVALTDKEEKVLDDKLERLEGFGRTRARASGDEPAGRLEPEPYSERDADRQIELSERELNALVARSPDLARRLAIDLGDGLVSAKLLVPLDEDFPVLGGRTLRLHAGVALDYTDGRPAVVLKGLSIMGVPMPNAWLGGLKNIDLVREFGGKPGAWKAFAAGVEGLEVSEGRLHIRLKE